MLCGRRTLQQFDGLQRGRRPEDSRVWDDVDVKNMIDTPG
jgi:hypothetical protein